MSKEQALALLHKLKAIMVELQADCVDDPEDILTDLGINSQGYEQALQQAIESIEKN